MCKSVCGRACCFSEWLSSPPCVPAREDAVVDAGGPTGGGSPKCSFIIAMIAFKCTASPIPHTQRTHSHTHRERERERERERWREKAVEESAGVPFLSESALHGSGLSSANEKNRTIKMILFTSNL